MRVAQNACKNVVQNTKLTDVTQNAMITPEQGSNTPTQNETKKENTKMKITFKNLNTNQTTDNGTVAVMWTKKGYEVKTIIE